MDFKQKFLEIKRSIRKFDLTAISVLIFLQIIFLAFPILESYLAKVQTLAGWVLPAVYLFHAVIGILVLIWVNNIKDIVKAIRIDDVENEYIKTKNELEKERGKVSNAVKYYEVLFAQTRFFNYSLAVLFLLLKRKCEHPLSKDIDDLLDVLIQDREKILGFSGSDLYNFALYIYNKDRDVLELFWRSNDNRIVVHNRTWERGVGHVGICFSQNKMIISPDTGASPELITMDEYNTDSKYYASIASVPIQNGNSSENKPIGVFVLTSSRAGHLTQELIYFLQQSGMILSMYFSNCVI